MAKRRRNKRQKNPRQKGKAPAQICNEGTMPLSQIESWGDLISGLNGRMITPESAMKHSAVYACVRILSGVFATIPIKIYEETGDVNREDRAHPINILLRQRPNPRMTAAMFWNTISHSMMLRGNGLAWIERLGSGIPIALWPIRWSTVSQRLVGHRIIYEFTLDDGTRKAVWQDDVLHFTGSMEWDGLRAKTPLAAYAGAVGIGMDANEFAQNYFKNDATPNGYIQYPEQLTNEQITQLKSHWEKSHSGDNQHSFGVLDRGATFNETGINAEDAQLLETRRFQIEDIARVFGVPPHMIGAVDKSSNWGTGIEQQNMGFLAYTANPHLVGVEQEIDTKLLNRSDGSGIYCKFERKALLRTDLKTRSESYTRALGGASGQGYMKPNEVRAIEGLEPVEGGDKLVIWEMKGSDQSNEQDPETDDQPTTGQNAASAATSVPIIPERSGIDSRCEAQSDPHEHAQS